MMNYDIFKNVVKARILEFLPPVYGSCTVEIRNFQKVNETKEALSVMPKCAADEFVACPNIYLDDYYKEFVESQDLDQILSKIAACIIQFTGTMPSEKVDFDLKNKKDKVIMNLINRERNRELLKNIPHKDFLDLAVIYRIVIAEDKDGLHSVLITNDIMEMMEATKEELDQLAMENTMKMFPAVITGFTEHLYMMTSTIRIDGATTMLYKDVIKQLSEKLGKNIYIIPSAVHEVMLVPEGSAELKLMKETLHEANSHYVTPKEFLSSNVYFYNKDTDVIDFA